MLKGWYTKIHKAGFLLEIRAFLEPHPANKFSSVLLVDLRALRKRAREIQDKDLREAFVSSGVLEAAERGELLKHLEQLSAPLLKKESPRSAQSRNRHRIQGVLFGYPEEEIEAWVLTDREFEKKFGFSKEGQEVQNDPRWVGTAYFGMVRGSHHSIRVMDRFDAASELMADYLREVHGVPLDLPLEKRVMPPITFHAAKKKGKSAEGEGRLAAATTRYEGLLRNGTELADDQIIPRLNLAGRKITLEVDLNQLGDVDPADIAAIGRIFTHADQLVPMAWRELPREALPAALNQARDFLSEKGAGAVDLALIDPQIAGDAVGEWGAVLESHGMPGILMTPAVLSALNELRKNGRDRDLAIVLAAIRQAGGIILGFEIEEKAGQRKLYLYA